MSDDMSMFKKMKERITDEVHSATNKLQNMQIMDQLTSGVGSQILPPNQLLPEPQAPSNNNGQFSLIEEAFKDSYNEEEELNSDLSPQQQLFNGRTIMKLKPQDQPVSSNGERGNPHDTQSANELLDIEGLSSDLDEDMDLEIDLLSDPPTQIDGTMSSNDKSKAKYRNLVHTLRQINSRYEQERNEFEAQKKDLTNQIAALKSDLDNSKLQANSDNDKSSVGSPQLSTKSSTKQRDLERLLAKCKESLKQKNIQIQVLKESLSELEKLKDFNQELKRELDELREAHETWTVSIAENKRVMHHEIESKNGEIERVKAECNDGKNKIMQLKSAIQDLENRLVSTSVAHQRERESLIKDLTNAKTIAIRQEQEKQNHRLERVKLDLENSIEALKQEILNKDKLIIKNAEQFQQESHDLNSRISMLTTVNDDQEKEIELLKAERDKLSESFNSTKFELDEQSRQNESLSRLIQENESDIQTHRDQLDNYNSIELERESLKKEQSFMTENLKEVKAELSERNQEINKLQSSIDELKQENEMIKTELESMRKDNEDLTKERDSLSSLKNDFVKQRQEQNQQLVVRIISAIKNLETPNTSPGSDKSFNSTNLETNGDGEAKPLPDPLVLMEELSSLALDRCNAYVTASQRLQAVLLENSMLAGELERFKEDLNNLNRDKALANQSSIDELERLRSENQALIHDQHAYDDKLKSLELELKSYQTSGDHTYQIKALQRVMQQYQEENQRLKESLKNLEAENKKDKEVSEVPDSTQFEYLKNIVYQFMLGKQPLVLARVISAVFKFDQTQIEQICKTQELVQTALKQGG